MSIGRKICSVAALLVLCLVAVGGGSVASAQSMKNMLSNQIPFAKLSGIAKFRKDYASQERHYTYIVKLDCEDGSTASNIYTLRGESGNYVETWCSDSSLHGNLTYVSSDPVSIGGTMLNGYRYDATDEAGDWSYFFGSDDLTGQNGYVLAIGSGHYQSGTDPEFFAAYLATRSEP
jgi:hypothetical protein